MMVLPYPVRGVIVFLFYLIFTFIVFSIFLIFALVKFAIPVESVRIACGRILDGLASYCWVFCVNQTHRLFGAVDWEIRGAEKVRADTWTLILSNHQSWVDILVLLKVFHRKLPPYKFFIKKELLWIPMMGFCFWALDFPVMKRYSKAFLSKNPHLKGKDLEATRKACEKYKETPVTIMNFPEGTRFTVEKHRNQESPFRHLLRPKAGGTALVMYAMGDYLSRIIDVTIFYPGGAPGLWDYFCGKTKKIVVNVQSFKLEPDLIGNYFTDPDFKNRFLHWLNSIWVQKDDLLNQLSSQPTSRSLFAISAENQKPEKIKAVSRSR
jgi:1-acyl-sn-glycerol-3-phosphate acyltransferase